MHDILLNFKTYKNVQRVTFHELAVYLFQKSEKSPCKFGSTCYQSNPEHRAKYSHDAPGASNGVTSNNGPLPDVFKGMSFYIPSETENLKLLKRYIIAYPFLMLLLTCLLSSNSLKIRKTQYILYQIVFI